MALQEILDHPGDHILPKNFYRGPVSVNHPCVIDWNGSTLYSDCSDGRPAIQVNAERVTLRNLRVHVMKGCGQCIRTTDCDTRLYDVEINGSLAGFRDENPQYALPPVIYAGDFSASSTNQIQLLLNAPADLQLFCNIHGIAFFPPSLRQGENSVVLNISGIEEYATVYGAIFAERRNNERAERVRTRIYLSGQAKRMPPLVAIQTCVTAVRGMHVPIPARQLRIRLHSPSLESCDVEPFVFLLNEKGLVRGDHDLIYYQYEKAENGGVVRNGREEIRLDLDKISQTDSAVQRIVIAFHIYNKTPGHLFEDMKDPALILSGGTPERDFYALPLNGAGNVKTLRALEIYLRGGEWQTFFAGEGYHQSLKRLCESYGLQVEG